MITLKKANIALNEQHIDFPTLGPLTVLATLDGFDIKGAIYCQEKLVISANFYHKNGMSYNVIYIVIDLDKKSINYYHELDGILPEFFVSPTGKDYVSITVYHPDKDLNIMLPLFDRENLTYPKPKRPILGDFIGTCHNFCIFHDVDIFSATKPDKLIAVEFKNDDIKKTYINKIPFPKYNKLFIDSLNNQIHLIAYVDNVWLHRQIDEIGRNLQSRNINIGKRFFLMSVLNLSFTYTSNILGIDEKGKFYLISVSPEGKIEQNLLLDMERQIYSIWEPIKIAAETFVIRFIDELGNGWITIQNNQVIEAFSQETVGCYINLYTKEIFKLSTKELIISEIVKTKDDNYTVVFYGKENCIKAKNKELIILNRNIG
ncbi:hypothetical protein [Gilliamella sp. Pas-s27]|uniref:hypothetical protein n=1 Tax=Gilliamella sp. Pas-s27 TaxID=2687311 RepID=UPI0013664C13|nr:hypothetical protein [Gilliamella sp. Pas-s27]MWP47839.1 hypothetical protein [Gilliamella sp. Pas-s27]